MSDPEIEIFGQKVSYPKDKYGVISIGVVGIIVVTIAFVTLVLAGDTTRSIVSQLAVGGTKNGSDLSGDIYQIQFWTPSDKTLADAGDIDQRWQVDLVNGNSVIEKNDLFGEVLASHKMVSGFRRHEIFGKGRSGAKYGYWWVLTVSREYRLNEFIAEYQKYWNTSDSVYVEVLNYDGDYK